MQEESRLGLGMVPIGAVDKNGRQLHQFESVICEGVNSIILWSMFYKDFTGMTHDGMYLTREGMENAEYVLFNEEEQWEEVEDVLSQLALDQANVIVRLITSHHNMEGMLNEAVRALEKLSEETKDESSKAFAAAKVEFLKSLIPK